MDHYVHSIRLLCSADGFSSECPERLHIDFAKRDYRASNCKDYLKQMTVWLERQEALTRFDAYLQWLGVTSSSKGKKEDRNEDKDKDKDGNEQDGEFEAENQDKDAKNKFLL
jgi:hypothetical protein